MKKMKRFLSMFLACVLTAALFAGCSGAASSSTGDASKNDASSAASDSGETAKLTYILPGNEPAELSRGVEAVNKKLAADGVGVELELKYFAWDVWDQKINLMLSTGDDFDMFAVMNDRVTIANYASRNALADLTDIFSKYGENIIANCPELAIKSGQVGGKQYGIPAFWVESALDHQGLIRTDLLKKYGIDKVPTTWDELTTAFQTVMANWDGNQKPYLPLIGTSQVGGYFFNSDSNYVLYENMIYVNQDGTIKNYFETDTFKESCQKARDWYLKGLINPDVLTVTSDQMNNQLNTGDWLVHAGTIGDISSLKANYPDVTVDDFAWLDFDTETPEIRPYGTRNMQAVPASSKNPEASVKFFNWLYSSQENFDLFIYGEKGTDYNMISDTEYEAIVDETGATKYSVATWLAGNISFEYLNANAPTATNEHLYTTDKTAVDGIAALMTFDASSVQTQVADVNTQISAVIAPMACGAVDYDSNIENALNLLKTAGIDKIVAEFQAQYDASKK